MRNKVYRILSVLNDMNAFFKGKILQRIARRGLGKLFGKVIRKIK